MNDSAGLDLLVTTGSQSFTATVSEKLTSVEGVREVTTVDSGESARRYVENRSVDGVVVDDRVEEPVATVDRLTAVDSTTVVLLTDGAADDEEIETALDAGVTDVFPRTTASAQYELIAERMENDRLSVTPADEKNRPHQDPDRGPYREVFENVSDGLVIHDPESGEMVDVNEQFCDLNGYDREELVGESIGRVTAPEDEYDEEAARQMIERTREEGPQLFEWRNQRKDGETFPVEVHLSMVRVDGEERVLGSVRDITERKRRERKLRESERRFRLIAEHIDEIIYLSSADFSEILYINSAYEEIYGTSVENLYENPRSFVEAAHPDDREGYKQEVKGLVEDIEAGDPDDVYEGQYRLQRDGETKWVSVARFPVENDDGTVDRIVGRVQDVTERRRIERRLRMILERIDEAIYFTWAGELTSSSLHPDDFYAGYEEIWGRPLEEIFEVHEDGFFGTLHREERDSFRSFIRDIGQDMETGTLSDRYSREYRIQRPDGEHRWIRSDFYPTEWKTGPLRMVIVSRDVTERKRREREYEQIFNSVQDAIAVHDPETGEMVDVNDTFCELIGYTREETLELGTAGVSVESEGYTEEYAEEIIEEVIEEGRKGPYEWMIETKDGERRTTEVEATTAEIGGEDRIVSINRDITERKRREREYEQIFNMAGDGIVIHDPESGDIVDVNQQVADLLGYDRQAFFDRPMSEFQATDENVSGQQAREKILESAQKGSQEFEWPLETADGETVWVRARHETGQIEGQERIVALLQNITERRRREQEYEQIFNGVKDAILVIDPETLEILDANDAYLDLVSYDDLETIQELGVEGILISRDETTAKQRRQVHERVAETGEPELVEWRAETSDGELLWLEIEIAPAVINGKEANIAIHRDVTERRQLERRFRTIGKRVDEVIYYSDIDLNEVLYINDAYTDIWGRPVEEVYENPRAFVDSIHPEDVDEFREKRQSMLGDIESGNPDDSYEFSYRIERPDGELRWIESTGYPIVGDGAEPNRYVAMVEDVTEQYRREQTLETFHEATRQLTAADSHEDACQRAVQAAQDVLGFPLVAAYLYDDGTGTLEPTAITDRLETLDAPLQSFSPGDSVPWRVFVEGESIADPDRATNIYGPGLSPPDIIVPLGSHGVMFVGAPAERFDSEDIELAQILAATLEAALNHITGEQTLAERERELQRQQERAAQLERLNTIIRDIEQATVDQSSRSGIESAVCERLTDVEGHDLVWIGESTVGDDELVVRTSAGDKDAYIDALSLELASETAGHPVVAAHRNNEPQAVENIATDVSPGDWRTMALRHGIQSVIAVPIRYESILHGVLTVASEEPDAFDEATRDVIVELGRSIGYAITVTEREEALESQGTTEVEFDVTDNGLFMIRGSEQTTSEIRLERTVRRSGGSFSMFYRIAGVDPNDMVELAATAPSVEHARVISTDDDERCGLIEVTAPTWFGSVFTEHGAVVRDATADNGTGTIRIEMPRGADVRSLVDGFQERYPNSELAAQRQRDRTIKSLFELQDLLQEEVTDRQWEALETAYSAGYFSWPRETSGQEVAELIGVSQPTFNKHLRIAEQAAFRLLLEQEYPDLRN